MDFLPQEGYKRILVTALYIVIGGLLAFVFFKYLLRLLIPFIMAWLVALVIRPIAETLHKRTGISKKVLSVILVVLLIVVAGAFFIFVLDKLIYEFKGIVSTVSKNSDLWVSHILDTVNKMIDKVPFLKTFGSEEEMLNSFGSFAKNMFADFTSRMPEMLTRLVTLLPGLLFVSLILVMASYYFCADYGEINGYIYGLMPLNVKDKVIKARVKLKTAGIKVLKGYLLTVGITFLQLYAGFLILKTEYAFTIALVTALVDILPVIGVGTILIPWAAVKIIAGSYYQGFGLLIIFGVVSIVREILEPKIIGKSIGLHPLATLFSMYIGLKLCGFIGMISFPVLVIGAKSFFSDEAITEDGEKT